MNDLLENINREVRDFYNTLGETKEEILKAFIAKYGLLPDEIVIVEQQDGLMLKWWVEPKEKHGSKSK